MSKVLTNGIIIPDNGNRNWGGDLANNWNILDVHVGYMTDVKNRVTTLENSVAENTANIQINASNISALQTSKANDSDVVHKTGNESIHGVKNFYNVVLGEQDGVIRIGQNVEGALFCMLYYNGQIYNNSKQFFPNTNNEYNLGSPNNKWKDVYATNATINTSDRNAKTCIENIDDNILDAWGKVSLVAFKFKDAVEKKGDGARIHMGYIAQDIQEELNKYGINACDYGLFCYDKWDAQEEKSHEEEKIDDEGNIETVKVIDTPAVEAGETFGLRYIECLIVECAYLRKKNKELEDRITKLEKNLNT